MTLQEEIIKKIGDNKTKDKNFTNDVKITQNDGTKTYALGFYTYRGEVCILDGLGMDITFDEYDTKTQNLIHQEIISGNYK